jgi:gliding motility-associated-like protein
MKYLLYIVFSIVAFSAVAQQAPNARTDEYYVCPGDTFVFFPLANDNDPDGDSIFISTFVPPLPIISPPSGTFKHQGDSVIFIVAANFAQTVTAGYRVCDVTGKCSNTTITFTIDGVCNGQKQNRAPRPKADNYAGIEDLPVLIDPLKNDVDPDGDPLTWTAITQPQNGTLGTLLGRDVYRPNANFNGIDFFLYRACDTAGKCGQSIVTFVIAPVNDQPSLKNDAYITNEDIPVKANVLDNDADVDGDKLETKIRKKPANGTVVLGTDGNFIYTPNLNFSGQDEFEYQACDNGTPNFCKNAKVTITIEPLNDAPNATYDTINIPSFGGTFTVNVKDNDYDAEGNLFIVKLIPDNSGVDYTYTFSPEGELVVTAERGYCGNDTLYYLACDDELCDTGRIYLNGGRCVSAIDIIEGFSPNGDGINDKLYFEGLDQFAPASITVFNRYGMPVFEAEDYLNDWAGLNMVNNQPIPDGTYYYVLELSRNGGKHTSYLVINR